MNKFMDDTQQIRILIVDDHGMVRFGLRGYLQTTPGLTVVGEAACAEAAKATTTKANAAMPLTNFMPFLPVARIRLSQGRPVTADSLPAACQALRSSSHWNHIIFFSTATVRRGHPCRSRQDLPGR